MKKGDWYKFLVGRITKSIKEEYYFEAAFICYGIIEDRLTSILNLLSLNEIQGVNNKIKKIIKNNSIKLEKAFLVKNWVNDKYTNLGLFKEVITWCELYRNPLQHMLGDPRKYKTIYGDFHTVNTKDLAEEGENIVRKLTSAVMRYKKLK